MRGVGEILSEYAREGLRHRHRTDEVTEPESFYDFKPLPTRGPAVSNDLIDELREEELGLSGYGNLELSHQLQHDRVSGLLAELEREHGPIDPQVMEEVRREWQSPAKRTETLVAAPDPDANKTRRV
jgi:hypothetical protein